MTAAKILDVVARLPGCDGQAADAVSAYTQVNLEDAPNCPKCPNRNAQMFGYVFHDTKWANSCDKIEDPVVFLKRNLHGHPFVGLLWSEQGMHVLSSQNNGYICSHMWMTSKWLEGSVIWLSFGH